MNVIHLASHARMAANTLPPSSPSAPSAAHADLVALHMQAVNALSAALRQLQGPDCTPAMWQAATSRAHRGLSALHRACAVARALEV